MAWDQKPGFGLINESVKWVVETGRAEPWGTGCMWIEDRNSWQRPCDVCANQKKAPLPQTFEKIILTNTQISNIGAVTVAPPV